MAKLKVFRTSAGFDDAYVAAPSRKAALQAWGADADLFARGVAELVTDPALMQAPLQRPGEVIRVRRGTAREHLEALGRTSSPARKRVAARQSAPARHEPSSPAPPAPPAPPVRPARRAPRPSRAALDGAEQALAEAQQRHEARLGEIAARRRALEQEQRDVKTRFEAEMRDLEEARDRARARFSERLEAWAEKEG